MPQIALDWNIQERPGDTTSEPQATARNRQRSITVTIADYTSFTGHLKPTREVAHTIVQLWATNYFHALHEASNLEDFDQLTRRLSVELHATVKERHFDDVLNAVTEVYEVVDEESEDLRMNQLGTIDNKAELLDAKGQELNACINYLLDHAGFGISARGTAA